MKRGLVALALVSAGVHAAWAQAAAPAEVSPLPLGTKRIAASADECAVWRRELSFATSVEAHDASAFESHLHAGTVFNAGDAGAKNVEIEIAQLAGEQNPSNNKLTRVFDVSGTKPRILYVEGEPRWEFKFLRRAVEDDKTIEIVSMLRTSQNKIYRQNTKDAHELENGFPSKAEELFQYQAIILGSVDAAWFTPAQQELI